MAFVRRHYVWILLSVITGFGAFLRLYELTSFPPGLYIDEASIAYNAWSILETGRDEHAVAWPFLFEAFGEYKLPGYIYLTSIFIFLTGSIEWGVRLPSAIAGILSIPGIFLLVMGLLEIDHKQKRLIALCTAALFAISPWSLHFSRAGFEATVALALIIWGLALAFRGLKHHPRWLYVSAPLLLASIITYNSARVFVPLIVLLSPGLFWKSFLQRRTHILIILITTLVVSLPIARELLTEEAAVRATSTTYLGKLPPEETAEKFLQHYLDNFSIDYLFFHGDQNGRHSVKKMGMLYYFQLPLVLFGLYFFSELKPKVRKFIIAWLLLAALPAVITNPSPHALRSLFMLPMWTLISGYGAFHLVRIIQQKVRFGFVRACFYALIGCIVCFNLALYLQEYYIRYTLMTGPDWSNGYREALNFVREHQNEYDHIFIHEEILPVYIGLYLPIAPADYQLQKDKPGFFSYGKVETFSNLWFKEFEPGSKNLIVSPPGHTPEEYPAIEEINLINGDPLFSIWEVK